MVALALLPAVAHGQSLPDYMRISAGGWIFSPAVSQGELVGFLALPEEVETVGNNIQVMWFQRVSGEWQSWGWEGNSAGNAVMHVRGELADETVFDKDATLNAELCPDVEAEQPRQVSRGLFVDDPFQEILDVIEDRALLLDALGEAGWPTVRSLSTFAVEGVECNGTQISQQQVLLDDLAEKVRVVLLGQEAVDPNCGISWPCSCSITYGAPTCGAWVFSMSVPGMGGSTICHYTRSCSRTYTATGQHWTCVSCAGTGTDTYTECQRTQAMPGDPCTPPP